MSDVNNLLDEETFLLLGLALYSAQKFEFGLSGIASCMSHLPEAKKDRRFANLTQEVFLSSDPVNKEKRKITLGQLYKLLGDRLLLSTEELEKFISDRNVIVHEFWREIRSFHGHIGIDDPKQFLRDFIALADRQTKAMQGLLSHLMEGAAKKEGRLEELCLTDADLDARKTFEVMAAKSLARAKNV